MSFFLLHKTSISVHYLNEYNIFKIFYNFIFQTLNHFDLKDFFFWGKGSTTEALISVANLSLRPTQRDIYIFVHIKNIYSFVHRIIMYMCAS